MCYSALRLPAFELERRHQSRWRSHAQEPGEMWIKKYRQANVDEKKTVSDL